MVDTCFCWLTRAKLPALGVRHHCDGSARPGKFARDVELLKAELVRNPDDSRSVFYLAQSYRDLGNLAQPLEWYEKRATMGGWDEEVWYAQYQVACLQHRLGWAWPLVLQSYLSAYALRPTRLEPLLPVVRYYRENGQPQLARLFGWPVVEASYPDDILFIERRVYECELALEYARCCEELGLEEETATMRARATPERGRSALEPEGS